MTLLLKRLRAPSESFCQERRRVLRACKISQPQSSCIYTSTVLFEESAMFSGVLGGKGHVLPAFRKYLIRLAFVLSLVATTFPAQAQTAPQQPPPNPNQQDAP